MADEVEVDPEVVEVVSRALLAALPSDRVAVVVGDGDVAAALVRRDPERFVGREALARGLGGRTPEVLALSLEETVTRDAAVIARELGLGTVLLLATRAEGRPFRLGEALESLHGAGLVLAEVRRLAWAADDGGSRDRGDRVEAECAARLLEAAFADHPDTPRLLEGRLVETAEALDVYAERALEHAATRESERARERRLEELEGQLARLGGSDLANEVDALRAEVAAIKATRVWRAGASWWRLRDRLRGRSPDA